MGFSDRFPGLWTFLEQASAVVLGSLIFWLSLLPVVTAPAAMAGLFAAVGPIVRGGSNDWFSLYGRAFKKAFLPGLLLGLANLVIGLILYVDIRFFWSMGHPLATVVAYLMGSVAILVFLVNLYAWPLLAWYPQPFRPLIKRAFLLTVVHPFAGLGGWLLGGLLLALVTLLPPAFLVLLPLIGPGLWVTLWGFGAWRTLRRYETMDPLAE